MHTQSYKKPSKTDDKPDAETVLFLYVTVTTACNQNCTVFNTEKNIHLILSILWGVATEQ